MANPKSTPPSSPEAVTHSPTTSFLDLKDTVDAKARQLRAMLMMTYGEGSIRVMSEELQDAYMWACADMADDIVAAMNQIHSLEQEEVLHG